ncbi:zinc-binding dehydrogenase [Kutzneria sp. NPDC052558]|uniref:zinc-binding dehydrogenase n=1 Tax=Kutzneria sp. NPDC052558 TaxID=3364121 RepID=UPI0037C8CAA1
MLGIRLTTSGVTVGEGPETTAPDGWVRVRMKAASVNASDFAMAAGYRADPSRQSTVLGSDGAGITDDGTEVLIYPILAAPEFAADPMLDPNVRMLSQGVDGTFAETAWLPRANVVPKPAGLSWEAAAGLGTAWLTAYRMLFTRARAVPGETVLVQGAGGGIATALVQLGKAAGLRVWVVSRDPERGDRAVRELGADAAFPSGGALPEPVDVVLDAVGGATFGHSLSALRPGGRLVTAGASGGTLAQVDLTALFLRSLSVLGSSMGSRDELARMADFCVTAGISPRIDSVWPLADGQRALDRGAGGSAFGKVVIRCG